MPESPASPFWPTSHVLRRRQLGLHVSPPPRPDDPCRAGVAGAARVTSSGDRPAPAARGVAGWPAFGAHVAADAGVRGAARIVAPDPRRRSLPARERRPRLRLTEAKGPGRGARLARPSGGLWPPERPPYDGTEYD